MTDTTTASDSQIPDGIYFVQADGRAWEAIEVRDGAIRARTQEADAETHRAARDRWADIVPSDSDIVSTGTNQLHWRRRDAMPTD